MPGKQRSRNTVILIGVSGLFLLTWVTLVLRAGPIESDLVQRVGQALSAYAITDLDIEADGRDLYVGGEVAGSTTPAYVAGIVRDVWGVREVNASALEYHAVPDRDGLSRPRFDTRAIVRPGGDLSNPMDAGTCQRTMARLAAAGSLRFDTDGVSPMPESYPLLSDLAMVAYQCPQTRIRIGAHTDSGGDREHKFRLSLARAAAVGQYFSLAGIDPERIEIVGYGHSQPIASDASAEGRAANRRITFEVLPIQ